MSLATAMVEGASDCVALLDCICTLTCSNGFTMIASVTPEPNPAREYVSAAF